MNVEFRGVDVQITDAMRSFIEGKLRRFDRYLREAGEDEVEVVVSVSAVRSRHKDYAGDSRPIIYRVDMHMYLRTLPHGSLHAWEEDTDVFTALDQVLDEIERQLIKLKQRRLELRRVSAKIKERMHEPEVLPPEKPPIIEEELVVEKPLSVEDALFELQQRGIFFLPFINADTGELNIIYRKRGESYGLITTRCKLL
ncbi:MAG TPA: ribosome-associated translation inhibitor RaiA [Aquificaceae bacterium]|nr:ribosome-associated translation inhibitor RaiA [Aquificaceae bacterium]HIQ30647.1 ribosome-associated translation inhibitor RaiA [Aquifex aeolicus]